MHGGVLDGDPMMFVWGSGGCSLEGGGVWVRCLCVRKACALNRNSPYNEILDLKAFGEIRCAPVSFLAETLKILTNLTENWSFFAWLERNLL